MDVAKRPVWAPCLGTAVMPGLPYVLMAAAGLAEAGAPIVRSLQSPWPVGTAGIMPALYIV